MIDGFRAIWRGLRHLNQAGYLLIWCNVAWLLLTLPVITAPAAWAGMSRLAWTLQRAPTASFDDFWTGFKENLVRGIPIAIANAIYWIVFFLNWTAYAPAQGLIFDLLRGVWLLVIAVQLYVGPLYYAMLRPSLRGAFRNAFVMILINPLFTLTLLIGAAICAQHADTDRLAAADRRDTGGHQHRRRDRSAAGGGNSRSGGSRPAIWSIRRSMMYSSVLPA